MSTKEIARKLLADLRRMTDATAAEALAEFRRLVAAEQKTTRN
ncbi:hypothetical protein [Reyranella soli]|jgi:hypothetical protein|uniref:Uncharacterized protein n=1 Tax=Reyranella soli TaxID=1230389 RepID=A0A512NSK5_9HYPH|nr:hypothetical protein [Reyranella soli]GEP61924.1 hypothetical protein RSO01_90900 [Reyranella soli]